MQGLSTALLAAGTGCVVATLWPVEDRTTAHLMQSFYAELSAGRTVAGALHRAKQAVRDDPATSHPFYWAGFVTIGAGETRIPLARRTASSAAAATAVGVLVALSGTGLVIWWRRKQRTGV